MVDGPTPIDPTAANSKKSEKLIDAPTPVSLKGAEVREFPTTRLSRVSTESDNKENSNKSPTERENKGLGVNGIEDEMKNVAI